MSIVEKYDEYLTRNRDRLLKGDVEAVLREARKYSGVEEWIHPTTNKLEHYLREWVTHYHPSQQHKYDPTCSICRFHELRIKNFIHAHRTKL